VFEHFRQLPDTGERGAEFVGYCGNEVGLQARHGRFTPRRANREVSAENEQRDDQKEQRQVEVLALKCLAIAAPRGAGNVGTPAASRWTSSTSCCQR